LPADSDAATRESSKKEYIDAIDKMLESHRASFDSNGTMRAYKFEAIPYREDGILSKAEIAKLNAPYQAAANKPENRSKPAPGSLSARVDKLTKSIAASVPKLDENFISNLPGNWRVISDGSSLVNRLLSVSKSSLLGIEPSSSPGESKARTLPIVARALDRFMAQRTKGLYTEIVNGRGDVIRVYAQARNNGAIATNEDIKYTSASLDKIRSQVSAIKPITLSIVGPSSLLPSGSGSGNSRAMGYAFPGGGGHILPNRIDRNNLSGGEYNPATSWHSVPQNNYQDGFEHTAIHEVGHVMMYQYWGTDSWLDNGMSNLESDYRKYGVLGQKISLYGQKSVAEHFAEAFARYVSTGDATSEFRDLLRSKGLLKSQKKGA
jgi:hypothetical protein